MTERDRIVSDDELHAYVDGELPADRHDAVEAWLATHPEDAGKVADLARPGRISFARATARSPRKSRRIGSISAG